MNAAFDALGQCIFDIVRDAVREGLSGGEAGGESDHIGLSKPEAAELLGISSSALSGLIDRGEIPVTHIGRRVILRRSALEEYLRRTESFITGGQRWQASDQDVVQMFGTEKRRPGGQTKRASSISDPTGNGGLPRRP